MLIRETSTLAVSLFSGYFVRSLNFAILILLWHSHNFLGKQLDKIRNHCFLPSIFLQYEFSGIKFRLLVKFILFQSKTKLETTSIYNHTKCLIRKRRKSD